MSFSRDIRVYSYSHLGRRAQIRSAGRKSFQLAFALNVEEENAAAQGGTQFFGCLPDSRKHNLLQRFAVREANSLQFTAGDNIEPRPLLCQQAENAQI